MNPAYLKYTAPRAQPHHHAVIARRVPALDRERTGSADHDDCTVQQGTADSTSQNCEAGEQHDDGRGPRRQPDTRSTVAISSSVRGNKVIVDNTASSS
jgi:hypothetical protein